MRKTAWRAALMTLCAALAASCARVDSRPAFERWLAANAMRAESFARFEAALQQEGVSGVVPAFELWRVDQLRQECAKAGFVAPPEADWANIVATLRILRDQVVPAVGPLEVVSAYRDPARRLAQRAHELPRARSRARRPDRHARTADCDALPDPCA